MNIYKRAVVLTITKLMAIVVFCLVSYFITNALTLWIFNPTHTGTHVLAFLFTLFVECLIIALINSIYEETINELKEEEEKK